MFLLIDNYDSFTYNLVQAFYALGHEPVVLRNDDPAILDMAADPALEMVCISPGPGHPSQTGFCPEFLRRLPHHVPVLGVCLGHQLLGLHAGAQVDVGPCIMHGKQSEIVHDGSGLFEGLPNPMKVARYHSLVVHAGEGEGSALFTVTARAPEGEVMALQYRDRPWVGVQFHPESILTPDGLRLLGNFPQAILPRQGRDGSRTGDSIAARRGSRKGMAGKGGMPGGWNILPGKQCSPGERRSAGTKKGRGHPRPFGLCGLRTA